jgi:branched-chain amino acid transport system ATP-binding protein
MPILEVRNLVKDFGGLRAVDGLSLEFNDHQVVGIIGPNGSGKTTFFNLITGFLRPDEGKVTFKGQDITGFAPEQVAKRGIGRIFQIARPFAELSVFKNLLVAGLHLDKGERERQALELLERVDLAGLKDRNAGELSIGQLKLMEFARLLMMDLELALLDEPVAGVSPPLIDTIVDAIKKLKDEKTFIIVEHNVTLVSKLCERVVVLNEGRILSEGSMNEVKANPLVQEAYLGV